MVLFSSVSAAVEVAAGAEVAAERKMGLSEDELLKYMTRMRKIRSSPSKGTEKRVIVPVVLYLLDDIHIRDDIYWHEP
jgi:hypothetical protein